LPEKEKSSHYYDCLGENYFLYDARKKIASLGSQ